MYPDLITPRSHPELLEQVDYDPYGVMPKAFPPHPRVYSTAAQLQRARERAATNDVDAACLQRLIASCQLDEELPPLPPPSEHPDWGGPLLPWTRAAFHNALAWYLTRESAHRERALAAMRLAAEAATRTKTWNGHEHHESTAAARAYDLLATEPLDAVDDAACRDLMRTLMAALDLGGHRTCNNHNAMHMAGRLALASALGDRQGVHDVFYGAMRPDGWRYGMIHLMRHDFLADGMQWEGCPGYHVLVLGLVFEIFTLMEHLDVALWQRAWPALRHDDGFDQHPGWGPRGDKHLTDAVDALIYQTYANGDYCMLHDQVLGNIRATDLWWPVFYHAWELYREPRYAWAVTLANGGIPVSADGPPPAWLTNDTLAWIRRETRDVPAGEFPLRQDRAWSLAGRHENGCSLFPVHGSALLRNLDGTAQELGAYLYWGPHWAGHRAPACLHLDIHAHGRRLATAPHLYRDGYGDPRHLSWVRTTAAHNTVVVDQQSMFPYDFASESLWECDLWRDGVSDGQLESFQPGDGFKAVRAANVEVYPGVRLDRTVVLTADYVLDAFRVLADRPRRLDWLMHLNATLDADGDAVDLGQGPGYQHVRDARALAVDGDWADLALQLPTAKARALIHLPAGAQLIVAQDPQIDSRTPMGDQHPPMDRSTLIVRTTAQRTAFVSVWDFGGAVVSASCRGEAEGDLQVTVGGHQYTLAMDGAVTRD